MAHPGKDALGYTIRSVGRTIGLDSSGVPEEGAHAEKVDYGYSKHYGQAALWNRNVCLQLYETVYHCY